ncbi:MAG: hypothetical protein ACP5N2_00115 [Candidatus Nanoarchaeia archaeon]
MSAKNDLEDNSNQDEFEFKQDTSEKLIIGRIKSFLEAGDYEAALALCGKEGIDHTQFIEQWHIFPAQEEDTGLEQIVIIQNSPDSSQNLAATNPNNNLEQKYSLYSKFPYNDKQVITALKKLETKDLKLIINGCINSYASREIIQAFNVAEYLSKLSAIGILRRDKDYLRKMYHELEQKEITISEAFNLAISELDKIAYSPKVQWGGKSRTFPQQYTSKPGEQKERLELISQLEQRHFLIGLYVLPLLSIEDCTDTPGSENFRYLLSTQKESDYIKFIVNDLMYKWNNLEIKPRFSNKP